MREIDLHYQGVAHAICCYGLDGAIVDPGPELCNATLLAALGDEVPERILLTHIHLDHASGTGALVRRWPDVEVWVHESGAPHLVDPARLTASAQRLYGDRLGELFGEIVPVPEGNVHVIGDREQIGSWRAEHAPGHASHHIALLHEPSGTAFAGDLCGMRIGDGPMIQPTVPPEVDVEAWHASLDRLDAWGADRIAITHYGTFEDPRGLVAQAHERLDHFAQLAHETEAAAFRAAIDADLARYPDSADGDALRRAMPIDSLWDGLDRYWRTRTGASAP